MNPDLAKFFNERREQNKTARLLSHTDQETADILQQVASLTGDQWTDLSSRALDYATCLAETGDPADMEAAAFIIYGYSRLVEALDLRASMQGNPV